MSDAPLVRDAGGSAPAGRRRTVLLAAIVAAIVIALAAAGAWWFLGRQSAPDWDRLAEVDLRAPAGDAFVEETPWVMLQMQPAQTRGDYLFRLSLVPRLGTPSPGATSGARITSLTARAVAAGSAAQPLPLQPEQGATGALLSGGTLGQAGWWHLSVTVDGGAAPADYYLLLPDPNISGPGAVATNASAAEGEALYQRGLGAMTSLQSVRFVQWMADGQGNGSIAEHAVSAGGGGEPGGFSYRAAGGMEAIIIGTTRWVKLPGDLGWTKQEGAISVPPAEWGEEYSGATGFTLLGNETIDGKPAQLVAFLAPEVSEPQRRTAAWYLWWVDEASGEVVREAMVSRLHYMLNRFSAFDVPIALEPPAATPEAGTPAP